ncbi:MAG: endolytic transglycosylase MltG [bacterium]
MVKPYFLLLLLVISIISVSFYWIFLSPTIVGSKDEMFTLKIQRGTSFDAILDLMLSNGIIQNKTKIKLAAKILGWRSKLKAGKYEISGKTSSYRLLKTLVDGHVAMEWVTIPEGKNARQIASILKQKVEIDSARFLQLVTDSLYTKKLGINAPNLEGFLFPETYSFYWQIKSEEIIPVMVNQFKKQFDDSLRSRTEELGFSVSELITLASIIEGEAVIDSERTLISAVYHNRLKKGMLLQADPTIQYIIEDSPRRLLKKDLEIDSPYNTYKYSGLPPGPINNPGLASIKASLFPAKVKYLYFVAKKDGSHTFSTTLQEHLRAKSHFDQYRRKVRQMKRVGGQDGKG